MWYLLGLLGVLSASAVTKHNHYEQNDLVPIYTGRVVKGSPFEFYDPITVPICDLINSVDPLWKDYRRDDPNLGSRLVGQVWRPNTKLAVLYGTDIPSTTICKLTMATDIVKMATDYISAGAYLTYWLDDLPAVALLGVERQGAAYIYKHRQLQVKTNEGSVVAFTVETSDPIQLIVNGRMELTYDVTFEEVLPSSHTNRYHNYANMGSQKHEALFRIDTHGLVNSFAFVLILFTLIGYLIANLRDREGSKSEVSDYSITSEAPNLNMLRQQVHRRPPHTIVISCLIGLGAQSFSTFLIFSLYLSYLDEDLRILGQLNGNLINPLIFITLCSSLLSGVAGGTFIRNWGVRRRNAALVAQIGFPILCIAIAALQYRTFSALMGTTLAWSLRDMVLVIGLFIIYAFIHAIGFTSSYYFASIDEIDGPKSIEDVPQVAAAPAQDIVLRWFVTTLPACVASSVAYGPTYQALRCIITPFCVQAFRYQLFLHLVLAGLILGLSMILANYVLLCVGDGRWKLNSIRTSILTGIMQLVSFSAWSIKSDRNFSTYSRMHILAIYLTLAIITTSISSFVTYNCSWIFIKSIYGDVKYHE